MVKGQGLKLKCQRSMSHETLSYSTVFLPTEVNKDTMKRVTDDVSSVSPSSDESEQLREFCTKRGGDYVVLST